MTPHTRRRTAIVSTVVGVGLAGVASAALLHAIWHPAESHPWWLIGGLFVLGALGVYPDIVMQGLTHAKDFLPWRRP